MTYLAAVRHTAAWNEAVTLVRVQVAYGLQPARFTIIARLGWMACLAAVQLCRVIHVGDPRTILFALFFYGTYLQRCGLVLDWQMMPGSSTVGESALLL